MNNQNFKDAVLENSGLQLIEGANGRLYIDDVSLDLLVLTKKKQKAKQSIESRDGDMADEANTNKAYHGRRKIYNHNEMHVHVYLLGMASAVIGENEQTAANKTYTVENCR
jgi:hypothetical protein